MEEDRSSHNGSGNQTVQHKRACEVDSKPVGVVEVIGAELEISGYGTLLTA